METLADDEDDRPLPEHIIAVICLHTLRGLQYLHKARKIHRDIKGCNILLTEDGVAKLGAVTRLAMIYLAVTPAVAADFGIASQITTMQTHRNTRIGTPFWMAPEVISCSEYDDKVVDHARPASHNRRNGRLTSGHWVSLPSSSLKPDHHTQSWGIP